MLNINVLLTISWQSSPRKGPEEIKTHDRHPTEHRDPDAVERVAESLANGHRDHDEELVSFDVVLVVVLDVVENNQEKCC